MHTTGLNPGGGGLHPAHLTSSAYYTVIAKTAQAIKLKPYFRPRVRWEREAVPQTLHNHPSSLPCLPFQVTLPRSYISCITQNDAGKKKEQGWGDNVEELKEQERTLN